MPLGAGGRGECHVGHTWMLPTMMVGERRGHADQIPGPAVFRRPYFSNRNVRLWRSLCACCCRDAPAICRVAATAVTDRAAPRVLHENANEVSPTGQEASTMYAEPLRGLPQPLGACYFTEQVWGGGTHWGLTTFECAS